VLGRAVGGLEAIMLHALAMDSLVVTDAAQHNLKNVSVSLPRNKLVVITGPSGSGKSSLAFDTIYAEGQRRYVESLSAYARQFLDQLDRRAQPRDCHRTKSTGEESSVHSGYGHGDR
jgi:ABC-type glutathione transport system ATPase component